MFIYQGIVSNQRPIRLRYSPPITRDSTVRQSSYAWIIHGSFWNILISSHKLFYSQSNQSLKKPKRVSMQFEMIRREELVAITRGISTMNAVSQITSLIICSICLIGKFEWCYAIKKTTKYWSVTKQKKISTDDFQWIDHRRRVVNMGSWPTAGYCRLYEGCDCTPQAYHQTSGQHGGCDIFSYIIFVGYYAM